MKFRPCSGMARMTCSWTTLPSVAVEACSSSDCAVTSTLSVISPTRRLMFWATDSPTPTANGASRVVEKPACSTLSE